MKKDEVGGGQLNQRPATGRGGGEADHLSLTLDSGIVNRSTVGAFVPRSPADLVCFRPCSAGKAPPSAASSAPSAPEVCGYLCPPKLDYSGAAAQKVLAGDAVRPEGLLWVESGFLVLGIFCVAAVLCVLGGFLGRLAGLGERRKPPGVRKVTSGDVGGELGRSSVCSGVCASKAGAK